jgi:hypothetical protein
LTVCVGIGVVGIEGTVGIFGACSDVGFC